MNMVSKILVLLVSLKCLSVYSYGHDELVTALRVINNTCADTWCEGEFDFEFHSISTNDVQKNAVVELSLMTKWKGGQLTYKTHCDIDNIERGTDIYSSTTYGYKLKEEFFNALNLCISIKENQFHQLFR